MNALESFISSDYKNAMNYEQFRKLIDNLLEKRMVTGSQQSEDLAAYTELNVQRMNRLDKHYQVSEDLKALLEKLKGNYSFLTITEGWCGDSAQIVPVIEKMVAASPQIKSHYILRDDNPEIMDILLTNGSRSIPIVVCVNDDTREIIWRFGPRPQEGAKIVADAKTAGKSHEEMVEELVLWYSRNKQVALESELKSRIEKMG